MHTATGFIPRKSVSRGDWYYKNPVDVDTHASGSLSLKQGTRMLTDTAIGAPEPCAGPLPT